MNDRGARIAGKVRLNSLAIGLVVIVVAMGTILFFQTIALSQLQHQNTQLQQQGEQNNRILSQLQDVTTQLNNNSKQGTDEINQLNRHLDCIVEFFSQPDRSQKAISNIDNCSLQTIGTTSQPTQQPITPTKRVATTSPTVSQGAGSTSSTSSPSSSGSTSLGGSDNPSFLQRVVVTPLNKNIVQPVKSLVNSIL